MLLTLISIENCCEILAEFTKKIDLKITKTTIENELISHPDYPSLLSISDVLSSFKIENISLKIEANQLSNVQFPCIAQIKSNDGSKDLFTIISTINNSVINYFDPELHRWKDISTVLFIEKWPSRIVLLANSDERQEEINFKNKAKAEKIDLISKSAAFIALPLLALFEIIWGVFDHNLNFSLFLLFTLLGFVICSILLIYELDQFSPIIQQFCQSSKKVNCEAVLNSEGSKILGVSWSSIGFVYFTGSLLILIFKPNSVPSLYFLTWFNTLSIPYIFYSIFYQLRIAKQWCILCLLVQFVLILQLVTTIVARWHNIILLQDALNIGNIIPILLAFVIPSIVLKIMLPMSFSAKESRFYKMEFQKLKHNPQIFDSLLSKERELNHHTEGLGILLGDTNAANKIIKVCNPYCGPCARAHEEIEKLLSISPNVQVQIIFTASNNNDDPATFPVKHLLSVAEEGDNEKTKELLNEWYFQEDKNYEAFASKHPLKNYVGGAEGKIDDMRKWCDQMNITGTPTFFLNGHELPKNYSISDLKYFVSI